MQREDLGIANSCFLLAQVRHRRRMVVALCAAVAASTLTTCGTRDNHSNPFMLDEAYAAKTIEANLSLPQGARSLDSYKRYYAIDVLSGGAKSIVAVFLYSSNDPGIAVVDQENLPAVLDGGCDVVSLRYSRIAQRVTFMECNGVS